MREGKLRVDAQAPQTPWSQGAAFQTFYELGLTREEERNWFQDSPELHSIMETFLASSQVDLHYAAYAARKGCSIYGKLLAQTSVILRRT